MKKLILVSLFALAASATAHAGSNCRDTNSYDSTCRPVIRACVPQPVACDDYGTDTCGSRNSYRTRTVIRYVYRYSASRGCVVLVPIRCTVPAYSGR